MNDTTQTLIRSVLKIGAGYMVAHGLMDNDGIETFIACISGLIGIVWGVYNKRHTVTTVQREQQTDGGKVTSTVTQTVEDNPLKKMTKP